MPRGVEPRVHTVRSGQTRDMLRKTLPVLAGASAVAFAAPAAVAQAPGPEVLRLPTGYQPEGIARYDGDEVLVGSIPTGALTRVNVRTGTRTVLSAAREGRAAIGIKVSGRRVYVSGGPTGKVRVHHARTGRVMREVQASVPGEPTFINDVAVSGANAYFTDSRAPKVYVLPKRGGPLRVLNLTGEFEQTGDPATTTNLNGIVVGGRYLVVVSQGRLYRVDRRTGAARKVTLRGTPDVANGDGLLLEGRTLSVVQNRLNTVAQLRMSRTLLTATLTRRLTDPDFQVPTTITRVRGVLYAPNAKFGVATPAETPYEVVRVDGSAR
jgi:hypothetical protein